MSASMRSGAGGPAAHDTDVAIVGGGPAGSALAIRLAAQGCRTVVFERQPRQRWRASGVYSSPLTRRRLSALGVPDDELERLVQPINATAIVTSDGRAGCVIDHSPEPACGLDRVRLEEVLLERARSAGAQIHEGATVLGVEVDARGGRLRVSQAGTAATWTARLVVGADGPASIVARAAGVARPVRLLRRAAVTGHRLRPEGDWAAASVARIVVGDGWYLGIAPVPHGRVNLGLVVGERDLRRQLTRGHGLPGVMDHALARAPAVDRRWQVAPATDRLTAQLPLAHRVSRSAGPGFLLLGDAAGFIDPLSGEGLHRALVSAQLAEAAISGYVRGDPEALAVYDRRLRSRFRSKDLLSWLLQAFLSRPALAAYALDRLDRRADVRVRLGRTLADLAPGSSVLDPRFLGRLLAP